jgi:hypothetical protein
MEFTEIFRFKTCFPGSDSTGLETQLDLIPGVIRLNKIGFS